MGAAAASTYSVAVEAKRRAVVLDATLALSPLGLLFAQKLSAECDVWVSRHLWSILDDSGRFAIQAHNSLREALQQWDVARAEKDLAGMRLYWIGESLGTSLLPTVADPNLVPRFDTLFAELDASYSDAAGLDARLRDCAKDALGLSVALSPQRAIVFTAHDGSEAQPQFCHIIHEAWGISSQLIQEDRLTTHRRLIDTLFHQTGIIDLGWAGLRFAAVHIVAHRAAAIPSFGSVTEDGDFQRLEADLADGGWWKDAQAFWYPVSWC
jgi:hypothetical protein